MFLQAKWESVMLKKFALVSTVVLLSACSTLTSKVDGPDSVVAEFMGGDIKVTFNKDGQFESIQSAGTARVTSTLPSATEDAFIVASLRAKQQIAEFMKEEVEGDRFTNTLTDNIQNGSDINGQIINEVNSKIAKQVQENIKSKSKAILQGVYVESKKFDNSSNTVRVTVKSGTNDIAVAKQIRSMMGN
jgi:hypothetical protein